jgi:translation initiation factor IF-1
VSGDAIEVTGTVTESLRGFFRVEVAAPLNRTLLCRLAGRLSQHRIRVVVGDEVTVEVSAYDLDKGRITFRGQRRERQGAA